MLAHYVAGIVKNANLDGKLKPNGRNVQQLNLQTGESAAIIAFIKTLTGKMGTPIKNRLPLLNKS